MFGKKDINFSNNTSKTDYFNNLRAFVIILVVLVHISVTYSGIGSWYYKEKAALDKVSLGFFAFFQTFCQAFFMGLMFFISGYFSALSYSKKEKALFLKARLSRLGIPILFYIVFIHPLIVFLINVFVKKVTFNILSFLKTYFLKGYFVSSTGPLWFALALLIFTFIFSLFVSKKAIRPIPGEVKVTSGKLIFVIVIIGVLSFLARLVWPIGTDVINFQLCFFPQYIVLFILGILFLKHCLLDKLSFSFGYFWFKIALFAGIPSWFVIILLGGALDGNHLKLFGGFYWQSFAYSLWEAFFGVSISAGLISLFRKRHNNAKSFWKFLSDNSFAVYVSHSIILVAIAIFLSWVRVHPVLKFFGVSFIAVPACFLICAFLKKILACFRGFFFVNNK